MEENNQIREEVLQSVSGLSDEQLNTQVQDGCWTIMQVLQHLYLLERAITFTISDQLANGQTKSIGDKPIHLAINRSTKIKAPSIVEPENKFLTLVEMKKKLSESREALTKVVDIADPLLLAQRAYPHPVFGELSLKQWIPLIGLHEKRHIEQIEELKKELI
ncbi:DinB family protein [Bacillus sp. ISL-18]|uniref:DinB family protein n=1 Tax=Bacillus sp. ISL-18 TaxID=2819118 RepID=UPI001BE6000E|nr:DinB family protein [Bacillus sp. ISL-18]MBT2655430.1 DinB family protein [Bacillus sp. ISL-18]